MSDSDSDPDRYNADGSLNLGGFNYDPRKAGGYSRPPPQPTPPQPTRHATPAPQPAPGPAPPSPHTPTRSPPRARTVSPWARGQPVGFTSPIRLTSEHIVSPATSTVSNSRGSSRGPTPAVTLPTPRSGQSGRTEERAPVTRQSSPTVSTGLGEILQFPRRPPPTPTVPTSRERAPFGNAVAGPSGTTRPPPIDVNALMDSALNSAPLPTGAALPPHIQQRTPKRGASPSLPESAPPPNRRRTDTSDVTPGSSRGTDFLRNIQPPSRDKRFDWSFRLDEDPIEDSDEETVQGTEDGAGSQGPPVVYDEYGMRSIRHRAVTPHHLRRGLADTIMGQDEVIAAQNLFLEQEEQRSRDLVKHLAQVESENANLFEAAQIKEQEIARLQEELRKARGDKGKGKKGKGPRK